MIKAQREKFNKEFSAEKHKAIHDYFHSFPIYKTGFRLSETPLFLDKEFGKKIYDCLLYTSPSPRD